MAAVYPKIRKSGSFSAGLSRRCGKVLIKCCITYSPFRLFLALLPQVKAYFSIRSHKMALAYTIVRRFCLSKKVPINLTRTLETVSESIHKSLFSTFIATYNHIPQQAVDFTFFYPRERAPRHFFKWFRYEFFNVPYRMSRPLLGNPRLQKSLDFASLY